MQINKKILDLFQSQLDKAYKEYCERHQYEASPEGLITYMIDHQLVAPPAIRRFVINKAYQQELPQHKRKTNAIQTLASRLHLSERTIWTALRGRT